MARSLKVSPQYIAQVKQAVKRNGFPSQTAFAKSFGSPSESTVKKFLRGGNVDFSYFEEIAEKLNLDWQEISQVNETNQQPTIPNDFSAYDSSWVGRDKLIAELSQKLRKSSRFLLILGLTGIGKTALAERLAIELQDLIQSDWDNKLLRVNFDNEDKITDFASVAARWLEGLGEKISPDEKKPELLLNRLVRRLQDNRFLVLIDSMERLLTENEDGSWGDFSDQYWEKFFLRLLSAESCQSKLIVTSQDLPVDFHSEASRYNNFYQRQILYGLDESEQEALFDIEGLNMTQESEDRAILLRLGKAYKGHPLVLRVIIGEINSHPFDGNVQAYWTSSQINSYDSVSSKYDTNTKQAKPSEQKYSEKSLHNTITINVNSKGTDMSESSQQNVTQNIGTNTSQALAIAAGRDVNASPSMNQGKSAEEITQEEAVELLTKIEELIKTANLPSEVIEKATKYVGKAKEEAEEKEPQQSIVLSQLDRTTNAIKKLNTTADVTSDLISKLKPLFIKLASWLGVATNYFLG